jgi:hypothetical protein
MRKKHREHQFGSKTKAPEKAIRHLSARYSKKTPVFYCTLKNGSELFFA